MNDRPVLFPPFFSRANFTPNVGRLRVPSYPQKLTPYPPYNTGIAMGGWPTFQTPFKPTFQNAFQTPFQPSVQAAKAFLNPTTTLNTLMDSLDLSEQQSDAVQACFIHAGLNSIVKATRDDDPNGWLRQKVNQTIQVDPRTGNFTFNWANGQQMTITPAQLNQVRNTEYQGKPVSDLMLATETAWFQAHPEQKKTGGYAHDLYKELFGLDSGYLPISASALDAAKQKGVVSTISAHSNAGTFHAWSLDYEGPTWDLNNSDSKGGFKYLPQTQGMKNIDLSDAQLGQALLRDSDAYMSYFKIPA